MWGCVDYWLTFIIVYLKDNKNNYFQNCIIIIYLL